MVRRNNLLTVSLKLWIVVISNTVGIHEKLFRKLSENIKYNQNVLGTKNNVESSSVCGTLCSLKDGCVSFLYHNGENFCRMYDSKTPGVTGNTSYTGAVLYGIHTSGKIADIRGGFLVEKGGLKHKLRCFCLRHFTRT